jgi:hypothetical protein
MVAGQQAKGAELEELVVGPYGDQRQPVDGEARGGG